MAVWTAIDALHAPGPLVTKQTPSFPVTFPKASAMKAAPPSCRQVIKFIWFRAPYNASRAAK